MTDTPTLAQTYHASEFGRWTLFRRQPRRALAPYVHEIQGYFEEGGATIVRREVPSGAVPMILVFGPGFTLWDRADEAWRLLNRSFIAGLHQQFSLVGSAGRALCMQVDFTPWGARRFLRIDMSELADKVVNLEAAIGSFAGRLEDRLAEIDSWEARFDLIESAILHRIGETDDEPLVLQAWSRLARSHGAVAIEHLARDLECSRKHLAMLFRRHVGLPPKTMARIFRFEQAMQRLAAGRFGTLAELAVDCGYADQAHFNRDFVGFSGETPRGLRAHILPDGTGVMAAGR